MKEVIPMKKMRKSFAGTLKAKVVLEAIKGEKSLSQIASQYQVHVNQIRQWKKRVLEELPDLFSRKREKSQVEAEELQAELYRQIGQLKVELDWVKKKSELFT
jgi:transposase-like protein